MTIKIHDSTGCAAGLVRRMERKYYILPQKTGVALGVLRTISRPEANYPFEQINSLYFDTYDLEQHDRSLSGEYRKDKIRLRWYGEAAPRTGMITAFLELKSRQGFASTKQRLEIELPAESLAKSSLASGVIPKTLLTDILAGFGYFSPKGLLPVIRICYKRYRFTEVLSGQSIALDCHIKASVAAPHPCFVKRETELCGAVIEIKGQSLEIPSSLRNLKLLEIDWSRFSKYSGCIEALQEKNEAERDLAVCGLNFSPVPVFLGKHGNNGYNYRLKKPA